MGDKEKDNKNNWLGDPPTAQPDTTQPEVAQDLENKILYLRAEVENVRKRLQKEKLEYAKSTREMMLNDFFPVFLGLSKALNHYDASLEDAKTICEGVKMTLKDMEAVFTRYGVKWITGTECPFDPHKHEALATEERENLKGKTVIEEYEPGFTVHDQLVRPAKVKVGVPKAPHAEEAIAQAKKVEEKAE